MVVFTIPVSTVLWVGSDCGYPVSPPSVWVNPVLVKTTNDGWSALGDQGHRRLSPTTHTYTTNGIAAKSLAKVACPPCHLDTSVSHIAFVVNLCRSTMCNERLVCDRGLLGSLRLMAIVPFEHQKPELYTPAFVGMEEVTSVDE
jgi:hypothetical protein